MVKIEITKKEVLENDKTKDLFYVLVMQRMKKYKKDDRVTINLTKDEIELLKKTINQTI